MEPAIPKLLVPANTLKPPANRLIPGASTLNAAPAVNMVATTATTIITIWAIPPHFFFGFGGGGGLGTVGWVFPIASPGL
ncbi:hypothetical protein [Acinetobacter lactucae]|uniref:hypothetical protein n=1 Tax=Acinetobacter lactucae TaxID=1785128 RepID=UPI001F28AA04|nr:hypothetical protein [Acinetobacter lactucae]